MGREIRLIRALADEGYQFTLNGGEPPIPRDKMVRFTSLPKHLAPARSWTRSRPAASRSIMLRGDGQMNPDGVRDYDLLVPATVEALVIERHAGGPRRATGARPTRGARRSSASTGSSRRRRSREGAAPAGHAGARVRVDGEVVGEIGPGLVVLLGRRPGR